MLFSNEIYIKECDSKVFGLWLIVVGQRWPGRGGVGHCNFDQFWRPWQQLNGAGRKWKRGRSDLRSSGRGIFELSGPWRHSGQPDDLDDGFEAWLCKSGWYLILPFFKLPSSLFSTGNFFGPTWLIPLKKFPRKITLCLFGVLWLAIQYFPANHNARNRG